MVTNQLGLSLLCGRCCNAETDYMVPAVCWIRMVMGGGIDATVLIGRATMFCTKRVYSRVLAEPGTPFFGRSFTWWPTSGRQSDRHAPAASSDQQTPFSCRGCTSSGFPDTRTAYPRSR
uniref:Uncharacterized protein n=1 Tax=Anopheles braziliensis TaxID=58242 RepID=A0A2M3ZLB6_9DIPT